MLEANGRHAWWPAHVHFIVAAEGYAPVVRHIFAGGDPYVDLGAVFGVEESLIVPFELDEDRDRARAAGERSPYWTAEFDFTLASAAG